MCVLTKFKVLCWLMFTRTVLISAQHCEFTVDVRTWWWTGHKSPTLPRHHLVGEEGHEEVKWVRFQMWCGEGSDSETTQNDVKSGLAVAATWCGQRCVLWETFICEKVFKIGGRADIWGKRAQQKQRSGVRRRPFRPCNWDESVNLE